MALISRSIQRKPIPQGARRKSEAATGLADAKTKSESYRGRILELEYQQRVGNLLPRQSVDDAAAESGRSIRRYLDALVMMEDELTVAAHDGGVDSVRRIFEQ